MDPAVQTVFGLLGGLAVFIFGMNMMSESLQKVAGERMRSILALLTKNPLLGVLAGALTTAVLQSSSATTVLAIGFVSARLMGLPQAISIILGANIGTTITAQIIAFKISDYVPVFVFVGFAIMFFGRTERIREIGKTIFGFGVLFMGIETMGGSMKPLASSPVFVDMLSQVTDIPILGVAVGTLMTVVVQSSSATIAVLQNLASQPGPDGVTSMIGLSGAIPVLLGDNIGTTITALLASIGQSRNAKRVAVSHCLFNLSGALLFIWLIGPFSTLVASISPAGPEIEVISRQIANAHTMFNICMTLIWLPLIPIMVKVVMRVVPEKKDTELGEKRSVGELSHPLFLDHRLVGQPVAALRLVAREVLNCGRIVREALDDLISAKDRKRQQLAAEKSDAACSVCHQTTEYLAELFAAGVLTEEQANRAASLMRVLNDIDRIAQLSREVANLQLEQEFSSKAVEGMRGMLAMVEDLFADATVMVESGVADRDAIISKRSEIVDLGVKLRKGHMKRVANGSCSSERTSSFNTILSDIDRMCNDCVNIVEAVGEDPAVSELATFDTPIDEVEPTAAPA